MNMFFKKKEMSGINVSDPIIADDSLLAYNPEVPLMPLMPKWRQIVEESREDITTY